MNKEWAISLRYCKVKLIFSEVSMLFWEMSWRHKAKCANRFWKWIKSWAISFNKRKAQIQNRWIHKRIRQVKSSKISCKVLTLWSIFCHIEKQFSGEIHFLISESIMMMEYLVYDPNSIYRRFGSRRVFRYLHDAYVRRVLR